MRHLQHAKPERFNSGDIIFIKERVGVIYHGSVKIRSHEKSVEEPYTLAILNRGRIIGHKSDDGISKSPYSWLQAYDEDTEILWFEPALFEKMWTDQFLNTTKKII